MGKWKVVIDVNFVRQVEKKRVLCTMATEQAGQAAAAAEQARALLAHAAAALAGLEADNQRLHQQVSTD